MNSSNIDKKISDLRRDVVMLRKKKELKDLQEEKDFLKKDLETDELQYWKYRGRNNEVEHEVESSFRAELGSYKTFIVLSIFVDVFFVFTILAVIQKSKLDKFPVSELSKDLQNSYNNWDAVFFLPLLLKILLLCWFVTTYVS